MRRLKKILFWIVGLWLIQHLALWTTGNLHFYKTLADTVFKGRFGPSIYEYDNYPYRKIKAGKLKRWKIHKDYNTRDISSELREKMESLNTAAFLIAHDEELVYEEYWDGYSDTSLTNSWSMAKSYISMLIGVAITEGKIKSVDEPVGNYIPKFKEGMNSQLKIKHLLNMTSGIDFGENYLNPFGFMAKALYGNEIKELTLAFDVSYEPGTKWHYQGGNNILLGLILREATGVTPSEYFSEKVWKPLGAEQDALWSLDKEDGYEKGYCCVFSNARDFARLGQLMLYTRTFPFADKIIDKNYVMESVRPVNVPDLEGDLADHYGYAWWLMNYRGHDIFYARGINGQYTIMIPKKKLVIVRLGEKRLKKELGDKHPKDVYFYIDAALEMIEDK